MTIEIKRIYDKAYAYQSGRLMGTDVDPEYSIGTKAALLKLCTDLPNNNLLDLGAGDGGLGKMLKGTLPDLKWHGVDISHVGLLQAKYRFQNLLPVVGSGLQLPFRDNFFGAVLAADTLEHIPQPEEALLEIRRILSQEGKFVLNVPAPYSLPHWFINNFIKKMPSLRLSIDLIQAVFARTLLFGNPIFQPIDNHFKTDKWIKLLEAADLKILEPFSYPIERGKLPLSTIIAAQK